MQIRSYITTIHLPVRLLLPMMESLIYTSHFYVRCEILENRNLHFCVNVLCVVLAVVVCYRTCVTGDVPGI
jgi:hypothetical protein